MTNVEQGPKAKVTKRTRDAVSRAIRHVIDSTALQGFPTTPDGISDAFHPDAQAHVAPVEPLTPSAVKKPVDGSVDSKVKEIVAPRDTSRIPTVTLSMFSPESDLCNTEFTNHYVNRRDILTLAKFADKERFREIETKRKERILSERPELRDEYDSTRTTQVTELYESTKRSINEQVYRKIMEDFDLPTMRDAYDFYERQRENANEAIRRHGELIYDEGISYDINNLLKLPVLPADLIELYLSSDTKTKPQFREQIKRQLLLGHIAAEVEMSESGGAGQKLTQIQRLLDDKFYADSENEDVTSYGVFDNETNELKTNLTAQKPSSIGENEHIKIIEANTRKIAHSEIPVFTKVGRKRTADGVRKAIRKAQKYADERLHDQIRPDADVNDTHRMMVVVYGDSDKAKEVMDTVFDLIADKDSEDYFKNRDIYGNLILRDGNPTGLPTDVTIADESKASEPGKSKNYARRRIKIAFDGMPNPLEIIVQTVEEHVKSTLEIGTYDPITGVYKGPAHDTMSVSRERAINSVLFDNRVYPKLPSPDKHDDDIPFPGLEEVAHRLVTNRHVVLGGND